MSEIQRKLASKLKIGGHCHSQHGESCCWYLGTQDDCEVAKADWGVCKTHAYQSEMITSEEFGILPSVSPFDLIQHNTWVYGYTPVYPDENKNIPKSFHSREDLVAELGDNA